jgi:ABC-2 type transport system permease protein
MSLRLAGERQQAGHQALREAPRDTLLSVVVHELRMRVRGVIIWGTVLGLYCGAMVASYVSLEDQMQQFEGLLDSYPQVFVEAFGITDLLTIEGFLASQFFNWAAPLALSFFPMLVLAGAIAGAEERGTIDVLLGKPVPRWQLVVGSFVSVAISLLGIIAILGLFTWIPARLLDVDLSSGAAAEAALNLWPICLFFGGLALLCTSLFHRRALAVAIPAVVLFGMYLLDVLGGIVEDMEDFQSFSAFYYYGSAIEDGIDWANFVGLTLAAVVLVVLAALAFRKRDIYT